MLHKHNCIINLGTPLSGHEAKRIVGGIGEAVTYHCQCTSSGTGVTCTSIDTNRCERYIIETCGSRGATCTQETRHKS